MAGLVPAIHVFTQTPYYSKCYDGLRKKFAALAPDARKRIEPVLAEAGCSRWLA
jgi:hypothetical protein